MQQANAVKLPFRVSYVVGGRYKAAGPVSTVAEAIENAKRVLSGCAPINMFVTDTKTNSILSFTITTAGVIENKSTK